MSLVPVPSSIRINGKVCIVIDTMQNYHYRALVLPPLADCPRWLTNEEVALYTEQKGNNEPETSPDRAGS